MNIYELAEDLSQEIDESGKTRWSAKDVKEFFLSEGINLSLDEILQVWNACPNPVCACELLGCDQVIEASTEYTPEVMQLDMEDALASAMEEFMRVWGDYIGDAEDLENLVVSCLEHWIASSDYFED